MLSISSMPATPSTPVRARTPLYAVGGFLPSLDRAAHGMTPPEHLERSAIAHDLDSIGMHSANELARLTRLRQNEVDHLLDAEVCPASACASHPQHESPLLRLHTHACLCASGTHRQSVTRRRSSSRGQSSSSA